MVVTYIIRTFDLSMDKSETGQGNKFFLKRVDSSTLSRSRDLRPTLYYSVGEIYKQVGVYSVPIVTDSYRANVRIIIDVAKQLGIKKFPIINRKVTFVFG